ncbi:hypothetical protein [Paenibacillus elgii]|nr:hypothetical protein [Paenibacillus elgii]
MERKKRREGKVTDRPKKAAEIAGAAKSAGRFLPPSRYSAR